MNINSIPAAAMNGISLDTIQAHESTDIVVTGTSPLEAKKNPSALPDQTVRDPKNPSPSEFTIEVTGFEKSNQVKYQDGKSTGASVLSSWMSNFKLSEQAKDQYSQLNRVIAEERPGIIGKAWDFSLDNQGDIVVLHNGDLTDKDVEWLEGKLRYSALLGTLSELKSSMIQHVETQRGPNMRSFGVGRYDLNSNNFDKIIRFGDFLSKTNGEDANQIFIEQLRERATDTSKELTYSYLEKDGSITQTKEQRL